MSIDNFKEVIVETSTRTKILEERFDRHLSEIKNEFRSMISEFKELSATLREHEGLESKNNYEMNERIVKLESERGILAKALNALIATITGGLAGWISRHS